MKTKKASKNRRKRPKSSIGSTAHFSPELFEAVMGTPIQNVPPTSGDFDRLMRYVIFKESPDNPVYKENPLTDEEIQSLQKTCRENRAWAKVLTDLNHEYHRLLETVEKSSFSHIPEPFQTLASAPKRRFQLFPKYLPLYSRIPRLAMVFAATLIVGFGLMAGISYLVTPQFYNSTTITPATFTTRGEDDKLGSGIEALNRKDYPAALSIFQHTIEEDPHSDESLLASYLTGTIYLIDAKRTIFGLFPSFNQTRVDSGIASLSYILENIQSNRNYQLLEEHCRFMLGQAWLMKENPVNARQEFERVVQMHGIKYQESIRILSFLPPQ
jgi:hypothetical protein